MQIQQKETKKEQWFSKKEPVKCRTAGERLGFHDTFLSPHFFAFSPILLEPASSIIIFFAS